ncbi:MAG TPA: 30S ribosomal protein S16, partial [Thermoanaerobaculia bacterium]|nr:30S ribosomal protein S16 [Thermoanaerobaculia bacterium]
MLKIRLRRGGATHAPFYRIVVSDSQKTPSASTVEQIGHYDP